MAVQTILPGVTIDADAIARGLYEMLDANERHGIQFGLFPASKMRLIEDALNERAMEADATFYSDRPDASDRDAAAWRQKFVDLSKRAITNALMNVKPMRA